MLVTKTNDLDTVCEIPCDCDCNCDTDDMRTTNTRVVPVTPAAKEEEDNLFVNKPVGPCPALLVDGVLESVTRERELLTKDWVEFYDSLLEELITHGKVRPAYVRSLPNRAWYVISLTCCSATCCMPCCIWDSMCAITQLFCRVSCCWGCFCKFCDSAYSDIMKDIKKDKVEAFGKIRSKLDVKETQAMCLKYLAAFDEHAAKKTPEAARVANVLREQLVDIVSMYSPNFAHFLIKDDGNILRLRYAIICEWSSPFVRAM